jgi:hypothetical protein
LQPSAHQVRRQMSNDDRSESAANEESSGWGEHSGPQHGSSRDEHGSRHERSDPEKHILDRIGGRDTRVHENGPRLDKFTPRAEGRAWADCHARDQIGDVGRQRRNPDCEEGRVRHQRRDATSTSDDSRHDSGRKQRTCGFGGQRHMRSLA